MSLLFCFAFFFGIKIFFSALQTLHFITVDGFRLLWVCTFPCDHRSDGDRCDGHFGAINGGFVHILVTLEVLMTGMMDTLEQLMVG